MRGSQGFTLITNYSKLWETYFPSPAGKVFPLYYPKRKKKDLLVARQSLNQWKTVKLSQWKATTLLTSSFFQWTLCLQKVPWTPPFFCKRTFHSFVLWTCLSFTLDHMSQIAILCSWINSFCWRNISLSICLRSMLNRPRRGPFLKHNFAYVIFLLKTNFSCILALNS